MPILWALSIALASLAAAPAWGIPAFPEAEGFGAEARGGRGGRVFFVTNLHDSGEGSLRAAIEAEGPRTVMFRTGGTIVLERSLDIEHPYVTIAGQTAPGGGIQLRNNPEGSGPADSFPSLRISTHDVVVRYLRIRPGTLAYDASCESRPRRGKEARCTPPNDIDAIVLDEGAKRIVIDHVSAAWATDEIVDVTWARDVTIQWSIIAEALNYVYYDPDDPRKGKGITLGTKSHAARERYARKISIHHNLLASNEIRNPQATSACVDPSDPSSCLTDVRNNVIYNWGSMGTLTDNVGGHNFVNVVGNLYKPGPNTRKPALGILDWTKTAGVPGAGSLLRPFFAGNAILSRSGSLEKPRILCSRMGRKPSGRVRVMARCDPVDYRAEAAHAAPTVTTSSAQDAYEAVLEHAGAAVGRGAEGGNVSARDATDERLVSEVASGGGGIIDARGAFPGWPKIAAGEPAADSDEDGLPDAWEERYALPVDEAAPPTQDSDGDGYTDLEEFLNGTHPRQPD